MYFPLNPQPRTFQASPTGLRTYNKPQPIHLETDVEEYKISEQSVIEGRYPVGIYLHHAEGQPKISATRKLATTAVLNSAFIEIYEGQTLIYTVPFTKILHDTIHNGYFPLNMGRINLSDLRIRVYDSESIGAKEAFLPVFIYLKPLKKD